MYSFSGKIVDLKSGKKLCECDLNFLKSIPHRSYTSEFSDIDGVGIDSETYHDALVETHVWFTTVCTVDILKTFPDMEEYPFAWAFSNSRGYIVDASFYESNKHSFDECAPERVDEYRDHPEKYVAIYQRKIEVDKGVWYDYESFSKYLDTVNKRMSEHNDELKKYTDIRYSKEYFEMSEDAKNSLLEEIGFSEEAIEEETWEKDAAVKIMNILDFYASNLALPCEDEQGMKYDRYDWDDRKVALYLVSY